MESGMIRVTIKSLWDGLVGVRDKYIQEAQGKKDDLVLIYGLEQMLIKWQDLHRLMVSKSEHPFKDKFSEDWHYLCYYKWIPTSKQGVMNFG